MAVQKKFALGRGLDALISNEEVQTSGSSNIGEIELSKIFANPNQPRREFDPIALQELADSISEVGIIQPITLRKINDDSYQIIAGERRYKASALAGLKTIPAYNTNKNFHPKDNKWVGYIINLDNTTYYIAGDTDKTPENKQVKCDVAFVPIGGTYTMNTFEAAELVNEIKPKVVVPIHYGLIVGTKEDAINFKNLIDKDIECNILMK